nr:hypothetical protein [Tanacetum cinerariifolium]
PFEVTFLELVKLVIVSMHRYPIQVLVIVPLDNFEFSDSDDSSLRIHIASRLSVDIKTIELLTFVPPIGYSSEGMLVIAYWFLNPPCPRQQVFDPLDVKKTTKWKQQLTMALGGPRQRPRCRGDRSNIGFV